MWESSRLSRRGFLGRATAAFLRGAASGSPSAQVDPGRLVSRVTIPPQSGRGVFLKQDQRLKVIAPKGKQVSDLFAFVESSPDEYLCPRTTMTRQRRLYLESRKPFYSNKRRPLLMLEEDTVGVHDLLYPACDEYMYRGWGEQNHPSCRGNLNKVEEFDFVPVGYSPLLPRNRRFGSTGTRRSSETPVTLMSTRRIELIAVSSSMSCGSRKQAAAVGV